MVDEVRGEKSGRWKHAAEIIDSRIRKLHPAYFALVMSTGVVSVACSLLGMPTVARLLLWLNVPFYAVLWALTFIRAVRFGGALLADVQDHQRGVGFFTTVAATAVFGVQWAVVGGRPEIGTAAWWVTLSLWGVCMYTVFTALIVREKKPSLADGINGGWLVAVVATQSVCVLGCQISKSFGAYEEQALFIMLAFWLVGGMLYIWTISLIFYRYTFFRFLPSDLMPPYWINMGAMAISTLAGANLVRVSERSPILASVAPFLKGFTIMFWATATWWIPMLVILAVWRHVVKRFPVHYDPLYWGAVFPLGMYTTCTLNMSRALEAPFLASISEVFVYLALAAWSLAFAGLLSRLWSIPAALLGISRPEPGAPVAAIQPTKPKDPSAAAASSP